MNARRAISAVALAVISLTGLNAKATEKPAEKPMNIKCDVYASRISKQQMRQYIEHVLFEVSPEELDGTKTAPKSKTFSFAGDMSVQIDVKLSPGPLVSATLLNKKMPISAATGFLNASADEGIGLAMFSVDNPAVSKYLTIGTNMEASQFPKTFNGPVSALVQCVNWYAD